MANVKISDLAEETTPADDDLLEIVDVSGAASKKVTRENLFKNPPLAADSIIGSMIDFGAAGGGLWWEEIGRTQLGGSSDAITVSSLPLRNHLLVVVRVYATGGTLNPSVRFNNDTGSTYSVRYSANGAADTTAVSQTSILLNGGALAVGYYLQLRITNIDNQEKIAQWWSVNSGTAGAAAAPNRAEGVGKWANTSAQISRIDIINAGTGDFTAFSLCMVMGHD